MVNLAYLHIRFYTFPPLCLLRTSNLHWLNEKNSPKPKVITIKTNSTLCKMVITVRVMCSHAGCPIFYLQQHGMATVKRKRWGKKKSLSSPILLLTSLTYAQLFILLRLLSYAEQTVRFSLGSEQCLHSFFRGHICSVMSQETQTSESWPKETSFRWGTAARSFFKYMLGRVLSTGSWAKDSYLCFNHFKCSLISFRRSVRLERRVAMRILVIREGECSQGEYSTSSHTHRSADLGW